MFASPASVSAGRHAVPPLSVFWLPKAYTGHNTLGLIEEKGMWRWCLPERFILPPNRDFLFRRELDKAGALDQACAALSPGRVAPSPWGRLQPRREMGGATGGVRSPVGSRCC